MYFVLSARVHFGNICQWPDWDITAKTHRELVRILDERDALQFGIKPQRECNKLNFTKTKNTPF